MKTERLQMRVTPEQKALIKRAAAHLGLSTSAFVIMVTLAEANNVIAQHNKEAACAP